MAISWSSAAYTSPMRTPSKQCTLAQQPMRHPCCARIPPSQEIGAYAWHRVTELPSNRDEGSQVYHSTDGAKHKFFMVRQASQHITVAQLALLCMGACM